VAVPQAQQEVDRWLPCGPVPIVFVVVWQGMAQQLQQQASVAGMAVIVA
jgi:hypothetical protein